MAEAPDPKTFGSWEDAFKYPIAAVQGMERQLRGEINTNRERLRSLVGASYRGLLGTAESIIEMDKQMQNVEAHIAQMSSRCNTRLLERKGTNLKSLEKHNSAGDSDKFAFASQMAVLRSCPDVISRLSKSPDSVLLAAKVLVLSRLLHTKLSQRPRPPPYLETLRNRLASLRHRLFARIDRAMKKLDQSRDTLVDAMCAFALATSSSPVDVLRHYHHVRLEAIHEHTEGGDKSGSISRSLRTYVNTLKETRAMIPNQFEQALETLTATPLVKTAAMSNIIELNLDLYDTRLGDDIMTFTPYIRFDDLRNFDPDELLKRWAKKAFAKFLHNLRTGIKDSDDIAQIMDLRNETLQLWFSNHQHAVGTDSAEIVDELRDAFNTQMVNIIIRQAASINMVSLVVHKMLQSRDYHALAPVPSLWAPSMLSLNTAQGAKPFREALTMRIQGRSDSLGLVLAQYARWLAEIETVEQTIQRISQIRWQDDVDDPVDEDFRNNRQVLLSDDDPRTLREELSKSIRKALNELQASLQLAAGQIQEANSNQRLIFLLRLWREVKQRLPQSYQNPSLGLEAIRNLQRLVSHLTTKRSLDRATESMRKTYSKSRISSRSLWEGDPLVPNLPSPWAFRFLRELSSSMADVGCDVWSPQSIVYLKRHIRETLASSFEKPTPAEPFVNGHTYERDDNEGAEKPEILTRPNGDAEAEANEFKDSQAENNDPLPDGDIRQIPSDKLSEEVQIQRLFDLLYLKNAMATENRKEDSDFLSEVQASAEKALQLSSGSSKRMKKAADEYWKRTSLLFALLA